MLVTETLVESDVVELPGTLTVPDACPGIVIFAHGSGSSRLSRRNRAVAGTLNEAGLATLLLDLLTEDEAVDRANVFDIALLARRMRGATAWVGRHAETRDLPVGYFGASTGAAAALVAAAALGDAVSAVVSRGGRPDLAGDALGSVTAPTLLIVGSFDTAVLGLNRRAQTRLSRCESQLVVIDGASHLFEEPGTLEQVAGEAGGWFTDHLV
jgi:putative phosphoribosyl transferase